MLKIRMNYHTSDKSSGGFLWTPEKQLQTESDSYAKSGGITPNAISNISAVPQATVKSILNGESKNPGTVTIKKLCDGFEITLGEFFSTPEFDELEQEIK
jgi:transcriptional regulator with XRE-family HTH domain